MRGLLSVFSRRFGRLAGTPALTFLWCPLLVLVWEYVARGGPWRADPRFLPLVIWGMLQAHFSQYYRRRHGGGGPGLAVPPERLVTSGPYAYTRNPVYLGYMLFLAGLALTLSSALGVLLTIVVVIRLHRRVRWDEQRLASLFGEPYRDYATRVRRWIPGLL